MTPNQFPTIWQMPVYLPYRQPKLTAEALAAAEARIGYQLPKAYIDLLQVQNGGYIRFEGLNGLNRVLYGIGPYFPNLADNDWSEYDGFVTIELQGLVPFDGDGHWHICLDYRKDRDQPAVTWISTESDREERVANSFAEYLGQLILDLDETFILETEQPLIEMVQEFERVLQTEWTETGSWAHGYPQYQTKWNDSWIWISANTVPKGFVRRDDKRYEELKAEMEGTAFRYPELPATALLLKVSEQAVAEQLQRTLSNQGMQLSPQRKFFE